MSKAPSKLRAMRLSAGLSQNQLARMANLDRGTISSAENGGNVSDLSKARILAALSEKFDREVAESELW